LFQFTSKFKQGDGSFGLNVDMHVTTTFGENSFTHTVVSASIHVSAQNFAQQANQPTWSLGRKTPIIVSVQLSKMGRAN
jgi:hypothetical protein